jgi:hypothetical protein
MPSEYFVLESGRDEVPQTGAKCILHRAGGREYVDVRRRWLDVVELCAAVATIGGVYLGLWWGVERALAFIPVFR